MRTHSKPPSSRTSNFGGCIQPRTWLAMFCQKIWMPGTKRVQFMKSRDMRYSSLVWPLRLGRQMCIWCRWFLHASARWPCSQDASLYATIGYPHCRRLAALT